MNEEWRWKKEEEKLREMKNEIKWDTAEEGGRQMKDKKEWRKNGKSTQRMRDTGDHRETETVVLFTHQIPGERCIHLQSIVYQGFLSTSGVKL